jgi:hypothetical protein
MTIVSCLSSAVTRLFPPTIQELSTLAWVLKHRYMPAGYFLVARFIERLDFHQRRTLLRQIRLLLQNHGITLYHSSMSFHYNAPPFDLLSFLR